jgi:hypothetical protein
MYSPVDYEAETIATLRANIPELVTLTDEQIADLYREYSHSMSAGWMILFQEGAHFKNWLTEQFNKFKFMAGDSK